MAGIAPLAAGLLATFPSSEVDAATGELRIAWNAAPPDFNPLTAVSRSQYWCMVTIYSGLVIPNSVDFTMEPDLAETIEQSPDGLSFTFKLRANAKWHDGTPVTAADVVFTYNAALNPDTQSKRTSALSMIKGAKDFTAKTATELTGVTAVDDMTVRFDMEYPNDLFLYEAVLPILPNHIFGSVPPADLPKQPQFISGPIGTGAFKFVEYKADQYVEVVANPDYHHGAPQLSKITFNIIDSPDTIDIALGREDIDMPVFDGGTAEKALYEKYIADPRFRIDGTQGGSVIGYGWNFRDEALADKRIHQALLYALDRPALVAAFNANNGTIFNSFMVHAWVQKPEWAEMYQFDPEKAKALLAEAGWDTNRTVNVNILPVANEQSRAMLAAEQQMLADVGFKIQFQEMEAAVWVDKFYTSHEFELVRVTFGVFPDPDGFLAFHLTTTSQNAFGYASPGLDARIEEARRTIGQDARRPLYQAINEEMLDVLPVSPLFIENLWWVRNVKWAVPHLDALTRATSLETIPVAPYISNTQDIWGYHQEQWTHE
jgi:peptide/nickel transport system substrate-binding protein